MHFILQIFVAACVLASCQTAGSSAALSGCYQMIINNDTATMSLNQRNDSLSGSLNYQWENRDNNTGTFAGALHNDSIIVAHYTFQSEGVTSVRQIAFKIRDSVLLQGYGELLKKNDTSFFRDVNLVMFDTRHPFKKGCE